MPEQLHLNATIPMELAGKRLDQVLAEVFSQYSRSRIQEWIKNGQVQVNSKILRQRDKVQGGENVEILATFSVQESSEPENIQLNVIHEDDQLIILNKPAGLVVHPGAGNPKHTLLNALLHFDPALKKVPRAGIIQRLDKDTSGLMVVARTPESQTYLVSQMQQRNIKREYQAIVTGVLTAGGTIDKPVGRHSRHRTRMAVTDNGKPAITHYRIITKYNSHTHIRVILETGRTHQIRVHMAAINYPIVGDAVYGGRQKIPKNASEQLIESIQKFPRQALHASAIELDHPVSKENLRFEIQLPEDMQKLINTLAT